MFESHQSVQQLHASGQSRTHFGPNNTVIRDIVYNVGNVGIHVAPLEDGTPSTHSHFHPRQGNALSVAFLSKIWTSTMTLVSMFLPQSGRESDESFISWFRSFDFASELAAKRDDLDTDSDPWILHHANIQAWFRQPIYSILVIKGVPGVGKTGLVLQIINALQRKPSELSSVSRIAVLHVLCNFQAEHSASQIICAAIYQLLNNSQDVCEIARESLSVLGLEPAQRVLSMANSFSSQRLWNYLCHLVRQANFTRVFLLIDGFSDCTMSTQKDLWNTLECECPILSVLISVQPGASIQTAIVERSRRSNAIKIYEIDLGEHESEVERTIDHFVEKEMEIVRYARGYTTEQFDEVSSYLMQRPRTFRMIKLMLNRLKQCPTDETIIMLQALSNNLQDLDPLFDRLISALPQHISDHPSAIINMVLYACRSLTLTELSLLRSHRKSSGIYLTPADTILSSLKHDIEIFSPLLEIRRIDNTIRFCDPSARSYLADRSGKDHASSKLIKDYANGHCDLAISCLRYLVSVSTDKFPSPYDDDYNTQVSKLYAANTLTSYVFKHWDIHTQVALSLCDCALLRHNVQDVIRVFQNGNRTELLNFLSVAGRSSPVFIFIAAKVQRINPWALTGVSPDAPLSALEFWSRFGVKGEVEKILGQHDQKATDEDFQSAIMNALQGSHESTLQFILENTKDTFWNLQRSGLVLAAALFAGDALTVEFVRKKTMISFPTIASIAVMLAQHDKISMLDLIFPRVMPATHTDKHGMNLLHHVMSQAMRRSTSPSLMINLIRFFKARGLDLKSVDKRENTLLHYVCWGRDLSSTILINELLSNGVDPRARNNCGCFALHYAARRSCFEAFDLLLGNTDLSAKNAGSKGGLTPLHWLVRRDFESHLLDDLHVMRSLLRSGCTLTDPSTSGETPLSIAIHNPFMSAVLSVVFFQLDGISSMNLAFSNFLDVLMSATNLDSIYFGLNIEVQLKNLLILTEESAVLPDQSVLNSEKSGELLSLSLSELFNSDEVACYLRAIVVCVFFPWQLSSQLTHFLPIPNRFQSTSTEETDKILGEETSSIDPEEIYSCVQWLILRDWGAAFDDDEESSDGISTDEAETQGVESDKINVALWSALKLLIKLDMLDYLQDHSPLRFEKFHHLMIIQRMLVELVQFMRHFVRKAAADQIYDQICAFLSSKLWEIMDHTYQIKGNDDSHVEEANQSDEDTMVQQLVRRATGDGLENEAHIIANKVSNTEVASLPLEDSSKIEQRMLDITSRPRRRDRLRGWFRFGD